MSTSSFFDTLKQQDSKTTSVLQGSLKSLCAGRSRLRCVGGDSDDGSDDGLFCRDFDETADDADWDRRGFAK